MTWRHVLPFVLGTAAGAVAVALWVPMNNSCIGALLEPAAAITSVENPYGILSCDSFPTPIARFQTLAVLIGALIVVGFLTARFATRAHRFQGASAASLGTLLGFFWWFSVEPKQTFSAEVADGEILSLELVLVALLSFAVGAVGAWFGKSRLTTRRSGP